MTACGTLPEVSTQVTYCCRPAAERVHSFRVEFVDMPEFLKPMLRDEASIVLGSKGIEYTEGDADAVLTMRYIDTALPLDENSDGNASKDESAELVSRFVARVDLELNDSVTRELIAAGSMSRTHNLFIGSYMHEAPARKAMHNAFAEIFAALPDPVREEFSY